VSYWTYPCRDLREAWYALLCTWRGSTLRRMLFYWSRTERALRMHVKRAMELGCDVYCVAHSCDAKECADDPMHA
jgi:hypothetical protein